MRYKSLILILIISLCLEACTTHTGELSANTAPPSETIQPSEPQQSSEPISPSTWIALDSVSNARQLGGCITKDNRTVKQNIILRTGELAELTDADKVRLANDYNLAQIIDLRDEIEVPSSPDPSLDSVEYHNLIVWPRAVRAQISLDSKSSEEYVRNYYTFFALGAEAIEAFRKMFEVLLENESGSILIHCMHGRDRTGIAVTLILSALHVERNDIEPEYSLSAGADVSSLQFYMCVIEDNYGSMENYLRTEIGLSDDDMMTLREKYTE